MLIVLKMLTFFRVKLEPSLIQNFYSNYAASQQCQDCHPKQMRKIDHGSLLESLAIAQQVLVTRCSVVERERVVEGGAGGHGEEAGGCSG
jgi:hypothetical protein